MVGLVYGSVFVFLSMCVWVWGLVPGIIFQLACPNFITLIGKRLARRFPITVIMLGGEVRGPTGQSVCFLS